MKIPVFYEIELMVRKFRNSLKAKFLSKFCDLKSYDLIFSMGEACCCATILKRCGLRNYSYPFDWMFGGTFDSRMNLLYKEFENFLRIEDMQYCGSRQDPEPCDIYCNKKTDLVFNHDFKINTPLEKSFPIVKTKYDRRIKRLLNVFSQKNKNVLIVYMELPESQSNPKCDSEIIEITDKLNNKFCANVELFYVAHDETIANSEYHYKKISPKVTKITLFNRDRAADVPWTGNFKNMELVLKHMIGIKL